MTCSFISVETEEVVIVHDYVFTLGGNDDTSLAKTKRRTSMFSTRLNFIATICPFGAWISIGGEFQYSRH